MSLDSLFEDLIPPPSRGRRASECSIQKTRDLNESDIELLWKGGAVPTSVNQLLKLRTSHHMLARLLAEGKREGECSLITGYTPSRISVLKQDPSFIELMAYYKDQVAEVYVDVHSRLAVLGLSSMEELADRLEENPDQFKNRELMDLVQLTMDRSGNGPTSKVQHSFGVSSETLSKIKDLVDGRQNGTVRTLTPPDNSGAEERLADTGQPILDNAPLEGVPREGNDV